MDLSPEQRARVEGIAEKSFDTESIARNPLSRDLLLEGGQHFRIGLHFEMQAIFLIVFPDDMNVPTDLGEHSLFGVRHEDLPLRQTQNEEIDDFPP